MAEHDPGTRPFDSAWSPCPLAARSCVGAVCQVTGFCQPRHRNQQFLRFLRHVARAYPDRELHLVMDTSAAHRRIEIRDWLAETLGSTSITPRPRRRG